MIRNSFLPAETLCLMERNVFVVFVYVLLRETTPSRIAASRFKYNT